GFAPVAHARDVPGPDLVYQARPGNLVEVMMRLLLRLPEFLVGKPSQGGVSALVDANVGVAGLAHVDHSIASAIDAAAVHILGFFAAVRADTSGQNWIRYDLIHCSVPSVSMSNSDGSNLDL